MLDKILEWFCDFTDRLMVYEKKHPFLFLTIICLVTSLITSLIIIGILLSNA